MRWHQGTSGAALILVMSPALAQQIDNACMTRCTNSGSTYAYCQSVCSYGNQRPPPATVDPKNFAWGDAFSRGIEESRQRRIQDEQLRIQREQAQSQQALIEEQRRTMQLENQRREAEIQQQQTAQAGQAPISEREREILERFAAAAEPRRALFPDFERVISAPDVAITFDMIELMSSSPYAADIAYYLGNNKSKAYEIARLPLLRQAEEIRKIEQAVQVGSGTL
jgi:small-conductance mechanosensitive channel